MLVFAGVLAAVGCGPSKIQKEQSVFDRPLATLADSGQVEARARDREHSGRGPARFGSPP